MRIEMLIKQALAKLGYQIQDIPVHWWNEDEQFTAVLAEITGRTLLDPIRCYMLYQFARQANGLAGNVAEVGVYMGGSARLLARLSESTNKTLHLFDTFSGLPKEDPSRDLHQEGDYGDLALQEVKKYLADFKHIRFHPGTFPETAKGGEREIFCFAHVDVDLYQSTRDCCEFFYPKLEKGGILLFDDYGSWRCPGVKKAVDGYFSDKKEQPIYLPTGQCVVCKV